MSGVNHPASSKLPALFAPVTYDLNIQKKIAEQAVLTLIDIPRLRCQGWPEKDCDIWINGFQDLWEDTIFGIAPLLKNSTFHHEKEWRVIQCVFEEDISNLQFRQNASRLTRYLPIDFPNPADPASSLLPIEAIQIGPRSDYDVTAKSLELMLQTFGYPKGSINIMKSVSSYRY